MRAPRRSKAREGLAAYRTSKRGTVALALLTACGAEDGPEARGTTRSQGVTGEILVSAAASLTDGFERIAAAFESAHPGVEVVLNLGGSGSLAAQILEGAPVDVFAAADWTSMDRVRGAGLASADPTVFARNRLQIAVPAGNPARITGLGDFARPGPQLGLCAETAPCGDLARRALARAGVAHDVDTHEPNVRALLAKIELGELDAGITYVTDVMSSGGRVEGIDVPGGGAEAEYPIVALQGAPNPVAAEAFVRFVTSDEARSVLARLGFERP